MKKKTIGKHHFPEMIKRGKDIDVGKRFEGKIKKRLKKRKNEKAGRKANRK